jgi:hypothetical protein
MSLFKDHTCPKCAVYDVSNKRLQDDVARKTSLLYHIKSHLLEANDIGALVDPAKLFEYIVKKEIE